MEVYIYINYSYLYRIITTVYLFYLLLNEAHRENAWMLLAVLNKFLKQHPTRQLL